MLNLDAVFKGMVMGVCFCLCAGLITIRREPPASTPEDAAVLQRCLAEKRAVQECLAVVEADRILRVK